MTRRAAWWPISFQRALERKRSHSRPHHDGLASGGIGSPISTPSSAAVRDRSARPSPRDHTNVSQMNGRARGNVMIRLAATTISVIVVTKAMMATGIAVRT